MVTLNCMWECGLLESFHRNVQHPLRLCLDSYRRHGGRQAVSRHTQAPIHRPSNGQLQVTHCVWMSTCCLRSCLRTCMFPFVLLGTDVVYLQAAGGGGWACKHHWELAGLNQVT